MKRPSLPLLCAANALPMRVAPVTAQSCTAMVLNTPAEFALQIAAEFGVCKKVVDPQKLKRG
jgi:hypothetical protein